MARIVVIDDEPHFRRCFEVWLKLKGHEVLTLADARFAVDVIRRERPDLAIVDVSMPEVSGLDIEHILREDSLACRIPVLLLTAKCADADYWREICEGVIRSGRPYLQKPFPPDQLQDAVDAMLTSGF